MLLHCAHPASPAPWPVVPWGTSQLPLLSCLALPHHPQPPFAAPANCILTRPHSTFTPPNVRHWLLRTVGICPVKASAEGNPQGGVGGIRSGQCPRPTSGREHSLWQGMASKDSLLFEQILELKGTSGLGRSSPTRSPLFSGASLPALLAAQCPRGLCPLTSSALRCQGWSEDGGDLSSALVAGMTAPRLLGAQGHHSRRYTHGPPVGRGGGTKGQVWSGQS